MRTLKTLRDAIATPTVADLACKTFSGVIYDEFGKICRSAQRNNCSSNEWRPSDADALSLDALPNYVSGCSLYLGHYTGHYGHFLLETLARLWPLWGTSLRAAGYDRVVFHPFLHKTPGIRQFSPARMSLATFGIDAAQVLLINEPLRFERLDIPTPLLEINYRVDPSMAKTYELITKFCLSAPSSRPGIWPRLTGWPSRGPLSLYLSRRHARGFHPMVNERAVERIFVDAGFKVLHPERWSFEQQVALYQRAEVVAGVEGSALHNSVFMRHGTRVINIGTVREPSGDILNQRFCDSLSRVVSSHIPFQGSVVRGHKAIYDLDFLKQAIDRLIK
jgi:hypothetical protein